MSTQLRLQVAGLASLILFGLSACAPSPPPETQVPWPESRWVLEEGWAIRAAADVEADGAAISVDGFDTDGWIPTRVPTTILAAQVDHGLFPDPYFADRLEDIPTEPYEGPWWYRTTFELDALSDYSSLVFDGINYRASVWLNGQPVADETEILGSFRQFEVDIRKAAVVGTNVLAVAVHPPKAGDFTLGFVDWNPVPPDRNMGLWRQVWLRSTAALSLKDLFVETDVDLDTLDSAQVTVSADVRNHLETPITGRVIGHIGELKFEQTVELQGGEQRRLIFDAASHPELRLASPKLWWPHTEGEPHLYELELFAFAGEAPSDRLKTRFGVRQVSDYMNAQGHRGYRINGKEILVRGGGWVDDLMLADDPRRIDAQMSYVKHMGLNLVRLEGFWGSSQYLYDVADELGILLMPGWSCQWEWQEYLGVPVDEEFGGVQTEEDIALVSASLADQARWLRNHPSIFVWVLASDMLPKPDLERRYAEVMPTVDPTRPLLAACSDRVSQVSGPTGVKMNGPYDYVTPNYWYVNKDRGGAFGFNTETGPGPQPPPMESLRRMLPEENLWPIDEMWEYHCGRHEFNTLKRYEQALNARYGPSDSVEEFIDKSQLANYEAMRAMFEAFAVRRPETTGLVQWMLNSAWPELYWQLYDHYLLPNGAFYGAKHATAKQNLIYDYGDGTVWLVRDDLEDPTVGTLTAQMRLFDLNGRELASETAAAPDAMAYAGKVWNVTELRRQNEVSFLDLRLVDAEGLAVADNFYWLSAEDDVLDEAASTWFYTPSTAFADFTALQTMATTDIEVSARQSSSDDNRRVTVELKNPSDALAFFIELRLVDPATDRSVLPALFDDNYVSLLPGESKTLDISYLSRDAPEQGPTLKYSGWNVSAGEVDLGS